MLLSESVDLDKGLKAITNRIISRSGVKLPHSCKNSTVLRNKILICLKCGKPFNNICSYYFHLKEAHSKRNDLEWNSHPKTSDCLEILQTVSDLISIGMIKYERIK
mgnify:CR=1 FL=1